MNDTTCTTESTKPTPSYDYALESRMRRSPVWKRNEELCRKVLNEIAPRWESDFGGDLRPAWNKIWKRLVKELNECEPFITFIMDKCTSTQDPFVVVDLCSGFGILSMLLSELLPASKVSKIVLLDKSFPLTDVEIVPGRHITIDHLVHRQWPIPLHFRKVDIKKSRELRQLQKYNIFGNYPVLLVGVHLCKALSVHAIRLYHSLQQQENGTIGLLLKPCCLPGKRSLYVSKKEPIEYKFQNGYSFQPRSLYFQQSDTIDNDSGSNADESDDEHSIEEPNKSAEAETDRDEEGGHKKSSNKRFSAWVDHLRQGCLQPTCRCYVKTVGIQEYYFQNQFLFCETIK